MFRAHVNHRDTIFSSDHWLLPKLDVIRQAFGDPITADEAEALSDVLYGRRWMGDLLWETKATTIATNRTRYRQTDSNETYWKRAARRRQ